MQQDNEEGDTINEDIVEEFARQLDQIVRIQDEQELYTEPMNDDDDSVDYDDMGYQQLPQDDNDNDGFYPPIESDDEEEDAVDMRAPVSIKISPSQTMDPGTTDLIKSIMNNISLPEESIPDWARRIPESAWFPRVSDEN
ncbi:hypothetical protein K501DRAFT_251561 [Backusella circina FSU 941]|nr:hypothetical protein K501DRAFT_251561 [Backusella circina FSU 941]